MFFTFDEYVTYKMDASPENIQPIKNENYCFISERSDKSGSLLQYWAIKGTLINEWVLFFYSGPGWPTRKAKQMQEG